MSARILLADSTPELRDAVGSVLRRECYEVQDAGDGEAALSAAVRGPIDLVLLDLDLRKLSGLDVLRKLRAVSTVPVIALSSRDSEVDRVLALELGLGPLGLDEHALPVVEHVPPEPVALGQAVVARPKADALHDPHDADAPTGH